MTKFKSLLIVFAVGMAAGSALPGAAKAQGRGLATVSTIYIPANGLEFRATDGTLVATISRDARGGFINVMSPDGVSWTRVPEEYRPGPGF